MLTMQPSPKKLPIKIEGQDKTALLASEFQVFHTANEFILNVLEVIPQMEYQSSTEIIAGKNVAKLMTVSILQKVIGRFGMSPAAFKKLVQVANHNLAQYEKKFGEIAINPPEGLH